MATSLVLSPASSSAQPTLSADIVDHIHALTLTNTTTTTTTTTNDIDTPITTTTSTTTTTTTTATTTTAATTAATTATTTPIKAEDLQNNPETGLYDEVEIEDMEWDEDKQIYTYPCPCGDKFSISKLDLLDGEEIARCPSCSLLIRVIYDIEEFQAQHGG